MHPDTAFALGPILDYSRTVGNKELEQLVVARSRDYYANDKHYNAEFEPSGEDFFSQSLNEADLFSMQLPRFQRNVLSGVERTNLKAEMKSALPRLLQNGEEI